VSHIAAARVACVTVPGPQVRHSMTYARTAPDAGEPGAVRAIALGGVFLRVRVGLSARLRVQVGEHLRHDGPEHVLCAAPTRSGKGEGLVVPTL
jgi:hypothetical protein